MNHKHISKLKSVLKTLKFHSTYNFDTYKLVKQLEDTGFKRGQSVALMRTINAFLVDSRLDILKHLTLKQELENELYLSKSHLQEVRNELSGLRQNDTLTLKGDSEQILREIENLDGSYHEQILSLKSDISLDLHAHKAESKELTTQVDHKIQEIHHKLIIRLSDLKTNIESMKVDLTSQIGWMTVLAVASAALIDYTMDQLDKLKKSNSLPWSEKEIVE